MIRENLSPAVLERRALVYIRQSTMTQVEENLESQRRQYDLASLAREYGFRDIVVIDEDLGESASGTIRRSGFETLVAQLCQGIVGAVFCLEASRLARNGRDWHHLLELCGLVGAHVVDIEGIYNPSRPNDRLLLGLKGTMSEFELTVMRQRLLEGILAKARRGELRICVPVGYLWPKDTGLEMNPDLRIQEVIYSIFRLFDQLTSARQVMMQMQKDGLHFPRPVDSKRSSTLRWAPPTYRHVISVLTNPFYAGAYAYGKSTNKTTLVEGRLTKRYGRSQPMASWAVLLQGHHDGYINWNQFEENQRRLAQNAYSKPAGGAKSGRGGRALLSGMLRCGRCGRMLHVLYCGRGRGVARYHCRRGHAANGLPVCIYFSASRPDDAVARQVLDVVQPLAVEAAIVAEQQAQDQISERRRALSLERQQAEYDVRLARRRFEAVDPDNRLVATELETRWNAALAQLEACDARLAAAVERPASLPDPEQLFALAENLDQAWTASTTTMRMKQKIVRTLIREIVVDVDDARREVILTIHWRGGQHSEARVTKPQTGEHNQHTPAEASAVIRDMAAKWSDEHIAATLNRMGFRTGHSLSWTRGRVRAHRSTHNIIGYASKEKNGTCLTMLEAAKKLGVTSHVIRRLIQNDILPARQTVKDAPWQIMADDLQLPPVIMAIQQLDASAKAPCRDLRNQLKLGIPIP